LKVRELGSKPIRSSLQQIADNVTGQPILFAVARRS